MRKIIVLLLVVGIVLGIVPTIVGLSEHCSVNGGTSSLYDVTDVDGNSNPAPCGGGMGSGGGGIPG